MSTEYQHWLLPADPSFHPDAGCAARIHAVLVEFGLAGAHRVFDVGEGTGVLVSAQLPGGALPANTLVRYDELVSGDAVAQLVGDDESEPYVQRRLVVVGTEQHVMAGSEEIVIEVDASAALSTHGPVAYIETEYFGGVGDQVATAFEGGIRILECGTVNEALRAIGVRAACGLDEWDTVGLAGHRRRPGA